MTPGNRSSTHTWNTSLTNISRIAECLEGRISFRGGARRILLLSEMQVIRASLVQRPGSVDPEDLVCLIWCVLGMRLGRVGQSFFKGLLCRGDLIRPGHGFEFLLLLDFLL